MTAARLSLAAFFLLFAGGCLGTRIVRVPDMAEVKVPEIVEKARGARLVFVGEHHDVKRHHRIQLSSIRAMKEAGFDIAIGLEMIRAEHQPQIDAWLKGELSDEGFKKTYYGDWHLPWRQYRDIFFYARDNRIPLVGLNVSKKIIQQVFKGGLKSLKPEQKKTMPEIKCEVDPTYREFLKEAIGEHESHHASFDKFCEAQMVWDTVMARNAVDYLKANPEKTLIVLAGSGHSWKRGIPEQVSRFSDMPYLVILPELPHSDSLDEATVNDADYLWLRP